MNWTSNRLITRVGVVLSSLLVLAACGCRESTPRLAGMQSETGRAEVHEEAPASKANRSDRTPSVRSSERASRELVRSINALGLDVYEQIGREAGSFALSPLSIGFPLLMLRAGARGTTFVELSKLLHLDPDQPIDAGGVTSLVSDWDGAQAAGSPTRWLNRWFGEQSIAFNQSFVERARSDFLAEFRAQDFLRQPEQSRSVINGLATDATAGLVREIVPRGAIDGTTRLVLLNALLLKGTWQRGFPPEDTRSARFMRMNAAPSTVPMMNQLAELPFASTAMLSILELNYRDERLSMVLVLPKAPGALERVEAELRAGALDGWIDELKPQWVRVSMPRFRIQPKVSFELSEVLSRLGAAHAFGPEANFGGIVASAGGEPALWLSAVFHRSCVEVDEKGSVAAAASAVAGARTGRSEPVIFKADHPFVFVVRVKKSGLLLFAGRFAG